MQSDQKSVFRARRRNPPVVFADRRKPRGIIRTYVQSCAEPHLRGRWGRIRGVLPMSGPGLSASLSPMFKTGSAMIDAEHAFTRARRAARLRRTRGELPVFKRAVTARGSGLRGIREIPLEAIA